MALRRLGPLVASLLAASPAAAQVVLNELSYDDHDADTHEFIELLNVSASPVDLSGWTIDCGDSPTACQVSCAPGCAETTNNNTDFTIPPGTVLPPGGTWVLGNATNVPNVNQPIPPDSLENDEEWIVLLDASLAVVDAVAYETNKNNVCFPMGMVAEGPGIQGNYLLVDGLVPPYGAQSLSLSRVRNGRDTNNNGRDFALLPWTPGASNDSLPAALPIAEDFDAGAPGTPSPLWRGSFVDPAVVDPTAVGPVVPPFGGPCNPNAIPASPQGGNALVFGDPGGGGNAGLLLVGPTDQVEIECYVYLNAAPHGSAPIAQVETWSLGLQGTSDSFGNHPDPAGLLASAGVLGLVDPNTGVAWSYVHVTDTLGATTAVLYLVDENDGGTDNLVLGSIPIVAGANDGWQRLRLRVNGARVEGWFGGTLGANDGTAFSGTLTQPGPGTIYFQSREAVVDNTTTRPLTIDALAVRRHSVGVEPVDPPAPCVGSGGCAPRMGWNGGTVSVSNGGPFEITMDRGLGGAFAMYVIGFTNTAPWPIEIGAIFGGGPCWSLNDIAGTSGAPFVGAGACEGKRVLTIPSIAGATPGAVLYVQGWVFPDLGSPVTGLPLVFSDGLGITLQP
ncbi:MAG TPA: lamin tail domain-containing protein [Planctomycetota bacterium]|nr:lamin tail domain-containing protein [Planctomycetota bacterium]